MRGKPRPFGICRLITSVCLFSADSYVRADGAFIPFSKEFDLSLIDTRMKGVGPLGPVIEVDLELPVASIVGKTVFKVGRTTGLTTGVIMAYAVEYDESKGVTVYTDFLVLGEGSRPFDAQGDSGSLIVMSDGKGMPPRPIGLVWGGTVNHGGLRMRNGIGPENWTSGIGLARLMHLLDVELLYSLEADGAGETLFQRNKDFAFAALVWFGLVTRPPNHSLN